MEITLKQADVKAAVRLYIERQGIHLHNKTLDIAFAMGRGENGLSATLTINDINLPVFKDTAGPSDAVKEMAMNPPKYVILPGGGQIDSMTEVADLAPVADPVAVETAEAVLTPADDAADTATEAVATPATEAAAAEPIAEAKAATEETPIATTEAAATPKATTSLFGN